MLITSSAAPNGDSTKNFSVAPATESTHSTPASQARIKNDICNGQFRIVQRGTSFVSPVSNVYDIDGYLNGNSTSAVVTIDRVAGSSTGKFARQITVNTADASIAVGDIFNDVIRIEGYRVVKYIGSTFTIAFRAKVPVSGIHCIALRNSGADRSYVHEINFPSANVWKDCYVTVTGGLPTAGTWDYTTGVGLSVFFNHACGSTYQTTPDAWQTGNYYGTSNQVNDLATIGNIWAIEDIIMCLGTYCPPDDSTYEDDLMECQRYYEIGNCRRDLQSTNTVNESVQVYFKVTKRAAPAVVVTNISTVNYNITTNISSITANGFIAYHNATASAAANFIDSWTATSEL